MLSRQMIDWERSTRTDHRVRHINGILPFVDVSLRRPLMHALDHPDVRLQTGNDRDRYDRSLYRSEVNGRHSQLQM